MYCIVDVETTGLSYRQEKITEIALLIYDGQKITKEFSSLVNPEKPIPYRITKLTGINNKMVAHAPRFCEIAKEIVELTEGHILVGHHINFDYGFLRSEFKSLGYLFNRKTLDTVKLSRKLIPHRPSYSLGRICNDLNISFEARHRALGDAKATAQLFRELQYIDQNLTKVSVKGSHSQLSEDLINDLPEETGVYYFLDRYGQVIYIGKAINIKSRVRSHLYNQSTKKALELQDHIFDVRYELTGSELLALLLESEKIKHCKPKYNSALRRVKSRYGLYSFVDDRGYICFKINKTLAGFPAIQSYDSFMEARSHLEHLNDTYELCQKLNGLYTSSASCFHHQIGKCAGACAGEEPATDYNQRAQQALNRYAYASENMLVLEKGRSGLEESVVWIEKGVYKGYAYIKQGERNLIEIRKQLQEKTDDQDARQIIRSFLYQNPQTVLLSW